MTNRVTPQELRKVLRYEPETGKLFWLERPRKFCATEMARKTFNTKFAGTEAFTSIGSHGYNQSNVLGHVVLAHRTAWALYHGEYPSDEVDHINHDRTDNRICNLRIVSKSNNRKNMSLAKTNKSGVNGVRWIENRSRWLADIHVHGKRVFLGHFNCITAAAICRKKADMEYGFHKNHGAAA